MVKNQPVMQETWVQSLSREDSLEKGMSPYPCISAWIIPRTEEPGGLQPMGSQRAGHDQMTNTYFLSLSVNNGKFNAIVYRRVKGKCLKIFRNANSPIPGKKS